jgi:hypothetical protein
MYDDLMETEATINGKYTQKKLVSHHVSKM